MEVLIKLDKNKVVVQKDSSIKSVEEIVLKDGWEIASEPVFCGQIKNVEGTFSNPEPQPKTQKQIDQENKLIGVEFDGVMCSATSEDQNGLLAVNLWVAQGGSTKFRFENESTLLITPANIDSFSAVWMPFRQGFFE